MPMVDEVPTTAIASQHQTVEKIVGDVRDGTPIRISFAQRRLDGDKIPGPLAAFVNNGDHRGLLLYLLMMSRATRAEPWNVALPSAVWARALGLPLPTTKTASSSISKAWLRVQNRGLLERNRSGRMADITLLREDASGLPYTHPKDEGGYFKLPAAFWLTGPEDTDQFWYEILGLPALAMLLVACSLQPNFALPVERSPEWYGFSADTAHRGFTALADAGLLRIGKKYRPEPLVAQGYTYENRYTLNDPFWHRRGRVRRPSVGTPE